MSKLNAVLENELKRFREINEYQDKLAINEVAYRFYNEEDVPSTNDDLTNQPMPDPAQPTGDTTQPPTDDMGASPDAGMPPEDPSMGGDAGMGGGSMPPEDPSMGGDAGMGGGSMPPEDPSMGGDAGMGGEEEVTELDVTDLVNSSKEMAAKTDDVISRIENMTNSINGIIGKVNGLEHNLGNMGTLIGKMEDMARQVELMRPPTEEERRKALAQQSYPFNITPEDYNNGEGDKNQTDMEKNSKMSMINNLLSDYNDTTVKNTFYAPKNNPLKA